MIHDLLRKRYSTRAFSEQPIENEKLINLFEAARWSPSAGNEQPWRFLFAVKNDKQSYNNLLNVLVDSNKEWAKNAPLLILTMANMQRGSNKINRYAFYDAGQAVAHLTIEATALDLYVRQMGGFSIEDAESVFSIPDNYEPITVLAVGYKDNSETFPEEIRIREFAQRKRKELSEIIFTEKFGTKSNLF